MMVAEHKQGFLRLMAEKVYRERQITDTGYKMEDIRSLGLPEEEWLWIQERVAEMVLAETHTFTLQ